MNIQRVIWGCILLVTISLLAGCDLPSGASKETDLGNVPGTEQVNDFFVDNGAGVVFRCNNVDYWTKYGYTLWTVLEDTSSGTDFTSRSVKTTKISGDEAAGYGIVLCHGTNSDGDISMFTIMINEKGYYTIGKVINAEYFTVTPWTSSVSIAKDGATNRIAVDYDSATAEFVVSFNGVAVSRFSGNDTQVNTNGGNGYIVVISPYDNFPSDVVEVQFEEE
jgi:hypothetical protein